MSHKQLPYTARSDDYKSSLGALITITKHARFDARDDYVGTFSGLAKQRHKLLGLSVHSLLRMLPGTVLKSGFISHISGRSASAALKY